jgi:hypothetical protein
MVVDKNLTGEQIQKVMDMLLYSSLEPIMLHSDLFDEQISLMLSIITNNRKRKLSSLPRDELISNLCSVLTSEDRSYKFNLFRSCRIERSFIHCFIKFFLADKSDYLKRYREFVYKPNLELRNALDNIAYVSGCTHRVHLYDIMINSSAYLHKFYEFRSMVLDNYLRHSSTQAKSHMSLSSGTQVDFHDLKQSILKAMVVALDKYDSSKGALTTYINWWILNAQTCGADHEYGVAYTIPQSQKKKLFEGSSGDVNFSISLDALKAGEDHDLHDTLTSDATLTDNLEHLQEIDIVRLLVKSVDVYGIARLVLDVGEVFSEEERRKMHIQTLEETVNINE